MWKMLICSQEIWAEWRRNGTEYLVLRSEHILFFFVADEKKLLVSDY